MYSLSGFYDFSNFEPPSVVEPNRITGVGRWHKRGCQKAESFHKQKKKTAARIAKKSRKRNRRR